MEKKERDIKKREIEALLFSVGKRLSMDDIAKLTKIRLRDTVRTLLTELKEEYEQKDSSIMVISENHGAFWKLAVREQHLGVVKRVVSNTELSKTLLETLAIIAYKAPAKQSEIIKIRTNKAYAHIAELAQLGYITAEKFGRTRLLKLNQKFYDYFDIPPDKLKEKMAKFVPVDKQLVETEEQVKNRIEKYKEVKMPVSQDEVIDNAIADLEKAPHMEELERLKKILALPSPGDT